MDGPNQVSPEAYLDRMRQLTEETLREVARAVNAAPDGAWINDSEWQVFAAFAELKRAAYERALQMRADAAAAAFYPDRPAERPPQAQQGQ
jgi:hypothetical protein